MLLSTLSIMDVFVYKISGFASEKCRCYYHKDTMPKEYRRLPVSEPEPSSSSSSGQRHALHITQSSQNPLYPHTYPPTYAVYPSEHGVYGHITHDYTQHTLASADLPSLVQVSSRDQRVALPWHAGGPDVLADWEDQELWPHPSEYDMADLQYSSYNIPPEEQSLNFSSGNPLAGTYPLPHPSSNPPRSHPSSTGENRTLAGGHLHGDLYEEQLKSPASYSVPPSTPSLSVNTSSPASDSSPVSSPTLQQSVMDSALGKASDTRDQKVPRPVKSLERRVKGAKITKSSKGKKPVKPRRKFTEAEKDKTDEMRYYGACWRCRRYKKPV